jgi:ubiquinone/menaquinone biosynthesis C-methylase UbiE
VDDKEVRERWEKNAEAWTELSRRGFDICRDHINTPGFLATLPDVSGARGLDIGCGEGHNTRALARLGARMSAVDIAPTFIRHAAEKEREEPLGIRYQVASGLRLPFAEGSFDFAAAFMSFMDMADGARGLGEVYRVLRPGGFLQFSITHPCFSTPYRRWLRDERGRAVALACGDYFRSTAGEIEEWIFSAAPRELTETMRKFRVPKFHKTLSDRLNSVLDAGFRLERLHEPTPSDEAVARFPDLADARVVAYYLHVICRKPR